MLLQFLIGLIRRQVWIRANALFEDAFKEVGHPCSKLLLVVHVPAVHGRRKFFGEVNDSLDASARLDATVGDLHLNTRGLKARIRPPAEAAGSADPIERRAKSLHAVVDQRVVELIEALGQLHGEGSAVFFEADKGDQRILSP